MDTIFDKQHLWHPYTSMQNPTPVLPVKSASGVRLKLADGKELIEIDTVNMVEIVNGVDRLAEHRTALGL